MALSDLTERSVRAAVAEYDRLGRERFLSAHRFREARTYFLEFKGKQYDSKAIAGVAHGYIGPGFMPPKSGDFHGGEATVKPALERLGFKVVKLSAANAPSPAPPAPPKAPKAIYPDWTRDELILALDFYLQHGEPGSEENPGFLSLCELINRLDAAPGERKDGARRSPAAVRLTISNFVHVDPAQGGPRRGGIPGGGKLQLAVWEDFSADPARLRKIADVLRRFAEQPGGETLSDYDPDEMAEAPEGRVFTRMHRTRERNRKLVEQRKRGALRANGMLVCEACGFDYAQAYGPRGHGYIEAHHTKPVHTLAEGAVTRLEDLTLLCANCHRMIHAARPWLTVGELRGLLATRTEV